MDSLIETLKNLELECGDIMLKANYDDLGVESKDGIANIVTRYDKIIQEKIASTIKSIVPSASIIGEEEDLNGGINEHGLTFIIDPIDGTNNFSRHLNFSSISIGVLKDGKQYLGVAYNPYMKEMLYAQKGMGAYLNGRQIKCTNKSLRDGMVILGVSSYYQNIRDKVFPFESELEKYTGTFRNLGSAVLEISYIGLGRAEAYVDLLLQPWDYCASSLIASESGCIVKDLNGNDIRFDRASSIVVANNEDNLNLILEKAKKFL